MTEQRYRRVKKEVGEILRMPEREAALEMLRHIPGKTLPGPLFSFFYSMDDLIRFRSTVAMGDLSARLARERLEDSRILLRRIMWNLNDESGGIGWGSPEAMGEILTRNAVLAEEFESILFSYIHPKGNFLEHEMLQRGALWGVGTYLEKKIAPDKGVITTIMPFLKSDDPVKRGYAARAFMKIKINPAGARSFPGHLLKDKSRFPCFDGWHLQDLEIGSFIRSETEA